MSVRYQLLSVSGKILIIFGFYIVYSASFFGNVFYSFYLCQTKNKNWRLKVMIFCMMVYAASSILQTCSEKENKIKTSHIFYAIAYSFENYVHWMFCYIYLKLQIEVKYLLDNRIYTANQEIIMQRNRQNFCLEIANILNIMISIGLLLLSRRIDKTYILILQILAGLQTVYLLTWAYALCQLFSRFKASEHLLPKKQVFVTHAVLLTAYLLCTIIEIVTEIIALNCKN